MDIAFLVSSRFYETDSRLPMLGRSGELDSKLKNPMVSPRLGGELAPGFAFLSRFIMGIRRGLRPESLEFCLLSTSPACRPIWIYCIEFSSTWLWNTPVLPLRSLPFLMSPLLLLTWAESLSLLIRFKLSSWLCGDTLFCSIMFTSISPLL